MSLLFPVAYGVKEHKFLKCWEWESGCYLTDFFILVFCELGSVFMGTMCILMPFKLNTVIFAMPKKGHVGMKFCHVSLSWSVWFYSGSAKMPTIVTEVDYP